jgi:hypothetical protein
MATERLSPNSVQSSTNLTGGGTVGNYTDDPDSPDALWATATGNNVNTDVRVTFPSPAQTLVPGTGQQEFRVLVRKSALSGTGTPTARIELWENATLVRAGSNVSVTAGVGGGQVISLTWNSTEITNPALVECKFVGTASGGSPAVRASVDIGAIEWNATEIDVKSGTDSGTFSATESSSIVVTQDQKSASDSGSVSATESGTAIDVSFTWKNNSETGTNGTGVTTGNSGGSGNQGFDFVTPGSAGTITYDSAKSHSSSKSIAVVEPTLGPSFFGWNSFPEIKQTYIRLYVYLTTVPGAECNLVTLLDGRTADAAADQNTTSISITTARKLVLYDKFLNAVATPQYVLPTGQWVRIELSVIHGDSNVLGSATLKVWGTTRDSSLDADADVNSTINDENFGGRTTEVMYGTVFADAYPQINFDDVAISNSGWIGPETIAVTPVSGTDSGTFSATEASSVQIALSSTDSGSISATESATSDLSSTSTDSGTLSATETVASLASSTTISDSGTLSATETAATQVQFSANDSGSISATESATIVVAITSSDSGSLSATDSSTSNLSSTGVDSGTLSATETRTIDSTPSSTDSGTLSSTETSQISVALASTDSGTLSATESSAPVILNLVLASDSGTISATETAASAGTATATDSGTFSATETSSSTLSSTGTDSGSVSATEASTLVSSATVSDSGTLSATETATIVVFVATSDSGAISATDSSSIIAFVTKTATDDGTISATESGTVTPVVQSYPTYVWNGTDWVPGIVKVWDGNSWVQKPMYVWNGSAWV